MIESFIRSVIEKDKKKFLDESSFLLEGLQEDGFFVGKNEEDVLDFFIFVSASCIVQKGELNWDFIGSFDLKYWINEWMSSKDESVKKRLCSKKIKKKS